MCSTSVQGVGTGPLTILASVSPRPSTKGLLLSAPSIAQPPECCFANGRNTLNWNLEAFSCAIFHLQIIGSEDLIIPLNTSPVPGTLDWIRTKNQIHCPTLVNGVWRRLGGGVSRNICILITLTARPNVSLSMQDHYLLQ